MYGYVFEHYDARFVAQRKQRRSNVRRIKTVNAKSANSFVIHYGLKMSKGTEYEWDKHFEYMKSETEKDKLKCRKGKSKRFVSSVRFVFQTIGRSIVREK